MALNYDQNEQHSLNPIIKPIVTDEVSDPHSGPVIYMKENELRKYESKMELPP